MTKEEAIKLIEHISIAFVPTDQYGDYDDPQPYEEALDMAIEALSAEALQGEWIRKNYHTYICNQCGYEEAIYGNVEEYRFCSHCGAKMKAR